MSGASPQPLPSGPRGLEPEFVAASQRDRLLDSLVLQCHEVGFEAVTIASLTSTARTAKRTFYVHFDDLASCFIAAYERIDAAVFDALAVGAASHSSPFERIYGAIGGMVEHFVARPADASVWALESHAAGPRVAARRTQTSNQIADLYMALHAQISDRWMPDTPMTRERALAVVGAVDLPLTAALRTHGATALPPALVPELSRAAYVLVYEQPPPSRATPDAP